MKNGYSNHKITDVYDIPKYQIDEHISESLWCQTYVEK